MNQLETMAAFQRVGEHCKARGYTHRLKGLREHWAKARQGEPLAEFARQSLEGFQLPPFEAELELRPQGLGCPRCGPEKVLHATPRTVLVLEDRARFVCINCQREWLELV